MDKKILSAIFSEYNRAKRALDPKRVDKALSLIQSGKIDEKVFEYGTTTRNCHCPDREFRGNLCKHMIALMIIKRTHKPKRVSCYHAYSRLVFSREEEKLLRICNDCNKLIEEISI